MPDTGSLTVDDRALLDFERGWWLQGDAVSKAERIRRDLSISPSAYYARLRRLAEDEVVRSYDPLLVARLRRRRLARVRDLYAHEPTRTGRRH